MNFLYIVKFFVDRIFCCAVVVAALEGKLLDSTSVNSLTNKNLSEEDVAVLFSGLLHLLQLAVRLPQQSLKQEARQNC